MLLARVLSLATVTAASINPAIRLGQRAPYAGGGWALLISDNNDDCPAGTTEMDAGNNFGGGPHLCCPNGFEQQGTGGINGITCCPKGSSCLDTLQLNPFCADSFWVLWNSTSEDAGSGYFCCLVNQIGTQDMACDSAAADIPATFTAQNVTPPLGQPTPTGAAGVTLSVSIAAGSTITSVATATTTTKGSVGGVVSSVLGDVTKKSDSSKNTPPLSSDIFKVITLFVGFGIAGFGGLIAMAFGAF
ncbi:hypothetical protein N431DRAFT_445896 [Stipitochalara longipes BDJ]|nr:hypothetical protein N431DRAFT_445896 [Stipitochalara longipes BDJ]